MTAPAGEPQDVDTVATPMEVYPAWVVGCAFGGVALVMDHTGSPTWWGTLVGFVGGLLMLRFVAASAADWISWRLPRRKR